MNVLTAISPGLKVLFERIIRSPVRASILPDHKRHRLPLTQATYSPRSRCKRTRAIFSPAKIGQTHIALDK